MNARRESAGHFSFPAMPFRRDRFRQAISIEATSFGGPSRVQSI
jgi:hypothetical protein